MSGLNLPGAFQIQQYNEQSVLATDYAGQLSSTTTYGEDSVWIIDALGDDWLRIMNRQTGRVLQSAAPGKASARAWSKQTSQWWRVETQDNGSYSLLQYASGDVLQANSPDEIVTAPANPANPGQSWNLSRIEDVRYQWIVSSARQEAIAAPSFDAGTPVALADTSDVKNQLWFVGGNQRPIVNCDSGLLLDIDNSNALCVNAAVEGKASQSWGYSGLGALSTESGQLLATASSVGTGIVAAPKSANGGGINFAQMWRLPLCIPTPDSADDRLAKLAAGAKFLLRSARDETGAIAATGGPDAPLTLGEGAETAQMIWTMAGYAKYPGALLNTSTPLTIGANQDEMLIGAMDDSASISWVLTPRGFLMDMGSGMVAEASGNNIRLSPYDPLSPPSQLWLLAIA